MDLSSLMAANLASVQQAVSANMMHRAMNADASSMATLLSDFQSANPARPISFGHRLDTRA